MFSSFGAESGNDEGNYSISRGMNTWRVLAQVITTTASRSVPYMAYISHAVTAVWCWCGRHMCVVFI